MTHTQKRILFTLNRNQNWRWWAGGNSWHSFKKLAKAINRPLTDTKLAVYDLEKKGILRHQWLVGNDGRLAGSGYLLSWEWDIDSPYETQ